MNRTVLCGQPFVVSLLKPWLKGPCSLQAKKKIRHTKKYITCPILYRYSPSSPILSFSHLKAFLLNSNSELQNVDFLNFF